MEQPCSFDRQIVICFYYFDCAYVYLVYLPNVVSGDDMYRSFSILCIAF